MIPEIKSSIQALEILGIPKKIADLENRKISIPNPGMSKSQVQALINSSTGTKFLLLDQTTPQTVANGIPVFNSGINGNLYATGLISGSQYPPAQNSTYVKATSTYGADYQPYFATDPTKSLTGSYVGTNWISGNGNNINQRFHIDLGSAKTITIIYYENSHFNATELTDGVKNFTFWGSNDAGAFADLTYGDDTNWTQLTTSVTQFDEHVNADTADPKYIDVTNTTAYRYYAFKFADNWGTVSYMGVRRIELQAAPTYVVLMSVNATNRKLYGTDGTTEIVNWSDINKIGFFAHTPVVQQAYTAVSNPPTQAEVTAIRDALVNLGLMKSL